jgi:hypothetical protein
MSDVLVDSFDDCRTEVMEDYVGIYPLNPMCSTQISIFSLFSSGVTDSITCSKKSLMFWGVVEKRGNFRNDTIGISNVWD